VTDSQPFVLDKLSDDEAYLFALLSDSSGLDHAEFLWVDNSGEDNLFCPHCGTNRNGVHLHDHDELGPADWVEKYPAPSGCFRAWAYQWPWWRDRNPLSIDQCARSVGKSLSIKVRGCAFPWLFPGQEMSITAPELVHLEPIVSLIESQMYATRALRELLPRGKSAVTHRPFQMNFLNGARLIGRIPQRDGKGVKGCVVADQLVLTDLGYKRADEVVVGDLVLTHEGRYLPVTEIHEDINDCYEVRGQSSFPLTVSCDHRFYGAENQAAPKQKRDFLPLGWHDVEFLTQHQVYWASPTQFPELPIPELPGFTDLITNYWLVGRWLADGYLSRDKANNEGRKVHWVAPAKKVRGITDALSGCDRAIRVVERDHSSAVAVEVAWADLHRWLAEHFGEHADGKKIPAWLLGAPSRIRGAVLDGYMRGDGWFNPKRKRWEVATTSKVLAVGIQMLAQSLGYTVNCSSVQPKVTQIKSVDLKAEPKTSWRLQIGYSHPIEMDGHLVGKVKSVEPVGEQKVYNIVVDGDHSYLTGSIMSHNIHPIWLELDEAQDYPHAGWVELRETLKRGFAGAMLRAHGVTKGVHDDFYEVTQDTPDNKWRVHRFAAMWRPNWTATERDEAIQKYGSREDPDYRRNVMGLHGDKMNPIFVLTQLMKNVDSEKLSDYNSEEYFLVAAKSEHLELFDQEITDLLDFPRGHLAYAGKTPRERAEHPKAIYWCGMDIGFTIDPSEILVFVEHRPKANSSQTVLKLLTRISMIRMPHREQIQAIMHTIDFYRPKAFAMDKAGNGLTIFQEMSEHLDAFRRGDRDALPRWMHAYDLGVAVTAIKGYNFSEKLLVDFDPAVEVGPFDSTSDLMSKAGVKRNAKEYGTDVLRELVDRQGLWLPWDDDLLKQFQGGTWASNRSMDAYGRRIFSKGNDHVLDAARMMALGWSQHSIEELMKNSAPEPVLDVAVTF
jgi:hypothetical protein